MKIYCDVCSNESYDIVPTARILEKLDRLFEKNDLESVARVLDYWDGEARRLGDLRGLIEILNEKIGYYRRTGDKIRGMVSVKEAFELIEALGLENTESAGTVYLNGATTLKSFGELDMAMQYYEKARGIYENTLFEKDYRLAAFYNNISSAYVDLGEYKKAEESCLRALSILEACGGYLGEMAVTNVNLAHIYYGLDNYDERIYEIMETAWELLMSKENVRDGNFAFICSKCYPSFAFFGYFVYEKTLRELAEKIYEGN